LTVVIIVLALLVPAVSAIEEICPTGPVLDPDAIDVVMTQAQDPYYNVKYPGWPMFFMKITLSGIDLTESWVQDGEKYAYCMEKAVYINYNVHYDCYMISTYDYDNAMLPGDVSDEEWAKINYILNHKQGNYSDVNDALYVYTNDKTYAEVTPLAKAMIDAAEDYEDDFGEYRPGESEVMGVYLYIENFNIPGANYNPWGQDLLIEVPVPPCFYIPELPLGTLTALGTMVAALFVKYRREH
jgi:hypothetical protein